MNEIHKTDHALNCQSIFFQFDIALLMLHRPKKQLISIDETVGRLKSTVSQQECLCCQLKCIH